MLSKILFKDFLQLVDDTYNHYSFQWRYGQTVMNVLQKIWPDKYREITGGIDDCFYDDGVVRITLNKLEKEWLN